ncbi:MAG: serine/threonine protein kinase, partial [Bacteroidetes bacterium HGW-Bacteroidetes-15]
AFFRGVKGKFQNHELDVKKGDIVYVFSDGYADQFGGEANFKFLAKRFRQLLLDIHLMPLNEQRDILEKTIRDWMAGVEQIDDITVVGIKV